MLLKMQMQSTKNTTSLRLSLALLRLLINEFRIQPSFTNVAAIASKAVDVIVAFILAMIAALIGVNLIGPVATAVGGALKNGNLTGAANSLTAQITLIFVTVVILGIVVFLALFGKLASHEAE